MALQLIIDIVVSHKDSKTPLIRNVSRKVLTDGRRHERTAFRLNLFGELTRGFGRYGAGVESTSLQMFSIHQRIR